MPERTEYSPGTPSWVDLGTTDLDAAKAFYSAVFGWETADMPTPQGGVYSMAMMGGKAVAGLMGHTPEMVEQGMPSAWSAYVTVDDLESSLAAVETAGGSVAMPPMEVDTAGRMAVVGDPTGAFCCLWQPKEHIGAQLVNQHGTLTWTDLMTNDPAAAGEFYSQVFGWEAQTVDSPMGEGRMFTLNGDMIASASSAPEGVPNHWAVYFWVDGCDACTQTITDNGGQVVMGPMDIPPGRMTTAMDPTGGVFNIIEPNPDFDPTAA